MTLFRVIIFLLFELGTYLSLFIQAFTHLPKAEFSCQVIFWPFIHIVSLSIVLLFSYYGRQEPSYHRATLLLLMMRSSNHSPLELTSFTANFLCFQNYRHFISWSDEGSQIAGLVFGRPARREVVLVVFVPSETVTASTIQHMLNYLSAGELSLSLAGRRGI